MDRFLGRRIVTAPFEVPVQFGTSDYLSGILSPAERDVPGRPTFLLLNAGLVHRVGPSRTYVRMARRLAAAGFSSLRFDHGGVGDSGNRKDGVGFEAAAAEEVGLAMDYLRTEYGRDRFVLTGLCSGARTALRVGAADERVVGVVSLDGQRFPTWRFWVHRYRGRRRSLLSALLLRMRPTARNGSPGSGAYALDVPRMTMPSKEVVEERLRTLVARGTHQYWIFTGGFSDKYNYERQHADAFRSIDFGDLLELDFLPDAEHTLTERSDQEYVVERLAAWAEACWPEAPGA